MPSVVSNKFRIYNAAQFKEALDEPANTIMYFYIGGVSEYANPANPPSPGSAPANNDFYPWRDMFAVKRIQASDLSHVIPRHDWTSGLVYSQYDESTTDIVSDTFFVVTDEFNVYKCLFNNGSIPSTAKPTGTSTSLFTAADGYIWKYMYSINTSDAIKFVTSSHLPVKYLTSDDGSLQWDVQQAAIDGSIDVIRVTSGGSGYASLITPPTVQIVGDGSGATATAIMGSVLGSNTVIGINVTSRGSGYTYATIGFTGGTPAAAATAKAVISPKGGHGHNPIEELGGLFLLINTRLDGSETGTFSTENNFRKIGLITDPLSYGTSNRAQSAVYRQTHRYTLSGITGTTFNLDDTITFGSNTATVVEYDSANSILYTTLPVPKEFPVGANLVGPTANGTVTVINTPGLKPYSGDIIYMENRVAVTRASDQVEDIKLIIEF